MKRFFKRLFTHLKKYYTVHHGTNRMVVIFPRHGFVVKCAKIDFKSISSFITMYNGIKKHSPEYAQEFFWESLSPQTRMITTVGQSLYGGFYENMSEWLFTLNNNHPLTLPTLFSFFGLFNIQQYGPDCDLPSRLLIKEIEKQVPGAKNADVHHFTNPDNYALLRGIVRMRDYGGKATRAVIAKLPRKLRLRREDFP